MRAAFQRRIHDRAESADLHLSARVESEMIEHAPMRQFSPIMVFPRMRVKGSITVSIPIFTPASMVTVSGRSIVTPESIRSRTMRSRKIRSTAASSTRVLMPSSSAESCNEIAAE